MNNKIPPDGSLEYENVYYDMAEGNDFNSGDRKKIADYVKTHAGEGARVLEVGCGTAEILEVLPSTVIYTGVDISSHAISLAKKKYESKNRTFLTLPARQGLADFPEDSFDFVVCIYTLEHLAHPREYLMEMTRLLKKGGFLILLAPNLELPTSLPNGIRHRSFLYQKIWFRLIRLYDYILRIFSVFTFRTIKENYTEATHKYERPDDDLRYVVSSYEVNTFLALRGMKQVHARRLVKSGSLIYYLKKIITFFPAMEYYGDLLFVIYQK